ncbi:MAG: class I SAM-dependent methyltransferase [Thermomicrobiales bacterium]|nr:class I SAM-dependent methyltransferase [Thermomicrobiales bacterium]MCO5224670.1 class I SAM-dependent methyltransferase [Thermomicrobiales bacterium]MCO5226673.1 class I SAM-dependent methyltransferase [Thermomicrobiales bacterium]
MPPSPLTPYEWLISASGQDWLTRAALLRAEGLTDLKIGEVLRSELESEQAALVLTQLDLRQRAAAKFAHPDRMCFTRAGLEQSTSEEIARYRAERYRDYGNIHDLCCGIGGDLIGLAALGNPTTAVDIDPVHLLLAEYNARSVTGATDIRPILSDVREVEILPEDAVFIDPARRSERGRMRGYESEPPLEWALDLADRAAAVGIKAAPGFPHDLVPDGWELELIALGHDVKEAVLWSPALATTPRRATVIAGGIPASLTPTAGAEVPVRDVHPGDWLLDLNPAVTNAGLVQDLARHIAAERIDPEIGFLVSDRAIETPFASCWRVIDVLPWHEKRIKQALKTHDIGPIDIRRRGLPGDVNVITKRLRGTGQRRAMIAMTRMQGAPTAIICAAPSMARTEYY